MWPFLLLLESQMYILVFGDIVPHNHCSWN
jgi:hypothetical protein